jgi:ArsR family transcriptional regulator, arsenate/arsenite/antimonite-responsive transcriptional repressor
MLRRRGVYSAKDQDAAICVCEFERYFDAGQSKVSYHLGKLKPAGLVHEERHGKWSYYSLDREAAGRLLAETAGPSGWLTGAQEIGRVS